MTDLDQARDRIEHIAQFMRLNYVPGHAEDKWEDAAPDERDAWLAEASHIYGIATGRGGL